MANHLIHLLPRPLHRLILRVAHKMRRLWRRWAGIPLTGVSVIVTDEENRVLLVRHSYGAPVWALPGGGLKQGEDSLEGARREMREELGIALEHVRLAGVLAETISGAPHTAHIVIARAAGEIRTDGREVIAARFFALDELPADTSRLTHVRLQTAFPHAA